jgi:hypothetical protein
MLGGDSWGWATVAHAIARNMACMTIDDRDILRVRKMGEGVGGVQLVNRKSTMPSSKIESPPGYQGEEGS